MQSSDLLVQLVLWHVCAVNLEKGDRTNLIFFDLPTNSKAENR